MSPIFARSSVISLLLSAAFVQTPQHDEAKKASEPAQSVASIVERCWSADELKSSRSTNFDQNVGHFQAEGHLPWCRTSLEAWGPVERRGKRNYFATLDSLKLRVKTDSLMLVLGERADGQVQLTIDGRTTKSDWWRLASRDRVLRLARLPLR